MKGIFHSLRARANNRRGIALLTVLIALMLITILLFEFQFSSMVEQKLAYNDLNQMQAYYLAKSGVRIGMLRVALYERVKRDPALKNMAKGIDLAPYLTQIWSLPLPPFPPDGGENLKRLNKDDRDAAEKMLKQSRVSSGKSSHVVTTESSKINLNFLVVPKELKNERIDFRGDPNTLFEHVGKMLINLMENFIKESPDPLAEYGNLRPEEVVYDIMDWVNSGSNSYGGGNKDSFYEQQNPPYKAKRNRLYTLEELRMVKSISPFLYKKLRPYVTVYSYDGKININEADNKLLRALYPDFTDEDLKYLAEEKGKRGGQWNSEKEFVKYITDTLGRSGFTTLYKDEKQYPFTVGSESFLVEGVGMLQRSGSTIQKRIRVATTLSGGGAGGRSETLKNITNEAQCNQTPGAFWDRRVTGQDCKTKPATEQACRDIVGSWQQQNGQDCCILNNIGPVCLTPQEKQGAKGSNEMKVLYWAES